MYNVIAMKTVIFYFTGTGNSLWIAKTLSQKLPNSELIPVASLIKFDEEADRAIFVFPVYAGGMPRAIYSAIQKIDLGSVHYISAVVNHGGHGSSTCIDLFNRELLKKSMRSLSSAWDIRMPGNYRVLYGAKSPEKNNFTLESSTGKIDYVARQISNHTLKRPVPLPFFTYLTVKIIWMAFLKLSKAAAKRFKYSQKCIGCGLCAKICPVNNIKIAYRNRPEWGINCEQCMACIQYCPEEAIDCFWWTKGRRRYRHPMVSAKMLLSEKTRNS